MFKVAHEQIGIGGAHGRAFDLEVMMGVEGEVVVGQSDKELSGW